MARWVVGGGMAIPGILAWSGDGVAAKRSAPRGELRVVDRSPLNFAVVVFNVFEHLVRVGRDGRLEPELATGWKWLDDRTLEVRLRRGVTFQNGEIFDADAVRVNFEESLRIRSHFHLDSFLNFKPGSRVDIVDPHTVRFVFPEPDGGALEWGVLATVVSKMLEEIGLRVDRQTARRGDLSAEGLPESTAADAGCVIRSPRVSVPSLP